VDEIEALFSPPGMFDGYEQTPSLSDGRSRSDRIRCGGRESEFLALLGGLDRAQPCPLRHGRGAHESLNKQDTPAQRQAY